MSVAASDETQMCCMDTQCYSIGCRSDNLAPGRVVLFTPDGWEDRIGGFTNIAFVADDVQRTYDELSAKGVEFSMPPKTEHWGTAAIFKDADGNQFVLSSRTSHPDRTR
jgi:predicted enzyme related to lactoylglutathione lyase